MAIRGDEVMELVSPGGLYRVAWINLNEGICEEYNPSDPNDVNLLRFDVYVLSRDATQNPDTWWEMVDDASYCTNMPAAAPEWMLRRGLEMILGQFLDTYQPETGSGHKKTMEWMSWIGPDDFKDQVS